MHYPSSKDFANSKTFGFKQIGNFKFNIILKGEFKKNYE